DDELNIVRSSNNLAIITTEDDSIKINTSIRSSHSGDMQDLKDKIQSVADKNNFEVSYSDGYPMWSPNFDNNLLNVAKESYINLRKKDPEIAVIHAGLECGIISEKYPDMNIVSCGPTILGAHTPRERLSIESTEFSFDFIKEILKNL
ncbi:M20/M25/M40 family metallo-hydrolase, partial [Rhodovulum adriaticum]|uniref:M20/M25/M40 family metallo-hydrolase n=1 Tax=Rhodovulum adriaticum TaxID=35804 RepID=UPI0019048628